MSTNPTAVDRDPGSLCERCRRCAGCHAEIGGCPVPNTSCVIGREDCGMPAESHLDCNESGLVTHSRHSFRRYPAATGREPEDRLLHGSKAQPCPEPVKRYTRVVDRLECPVCGQRLGERYWNHEISQWTAIAYSDVGPTYYRDTVIAPKTRTFKPCGCQVTGASDGS